MSTRRTFWIWLHSFSLSVYPLVRSSSTRTIYELRLTPSVNVAAAFLLIAVLLISVRTEA
jgi:hypothetical protein